jgi:hypothetical protein
MVWQSPFFLMYLQPKVPLKVRPLAAAVILHLYDLGGEP